MKPIFSLIVFLGVASLAFGANEDSKKKGTQVIDAAKLTEVCTTCHSTQGINIAPNFPSLAGQGAKYLAKQTMDIKAGIRNVPEMLPFVKDMSKEDINKIASFYASLPAPSGVTESKHISLGEQIYRGGSDNSPPCMECHAPSGNGIALAGFPRLAGLHADYIIKQLTDFREKRRDNDDNAIMRDVSSRLSNAEIEAVAHYIQGLGKNE